MQRLSILSVSLLAMLCGCASPGPISPAALHSYTLSADDLDFAVALARYSAGVAEEIRNGPTKGKSADFFLDAATRDPSNYRLARKASIGLLYQRRTDEAAQLLETALIHCPTNYAILLDLANVYNIGDESEKRVSTYERATTLAPSDPAAYMASARSYLAEGQLDKALAVLKTGAKHSDPQLMADLALISAASLLKGGFPDRSIAWFEFTSKHSKKNGSRIHVILAEMLEGKGYRSKALEHYELALRSANPMPDTFVRMAMLIGETDLESALKLLKSAAQRFPMDSLVLSAIVYIADAHDDLDSAAVLLRSIDAESKTALTADFYLHLGSTEEQLRNLKAAEESFKKGIEAYPDSHEMLNYLAYMWAEKGMNLDEGEKMVKRALEFEADSGPYLDTLGWIYFMQGRNKEAHDAIVKALKEDPDDPTIHDHLGDILAKDGRMDEAIKEWEKSYSIDASNEKVKQKLAKHASPPEKDQTK